MIDALAASWAERRVPMTKPLFDTIAIIGPGLIGSSIMRAARATAPCARSWPPRARPRRGRAWPSLASPTEWWRPTREAVEGADLVIVCVPVGACGAVAKEIGPASQARRDRVRCGLGEGLGGARHGPASAEQRAFRAGPSGRRHRAFRSRCRLCRAVRKPLVHPDAARGHRPAGGGPARRVLASARRQGRDYDARAPRPRARHHQPHAASDRLQHRRHRRRRGAGHRNPR